MTIHAHNRKSGEQFIRAIVHDHDVSRAKSVEFHSDIINEQVRTDDSLEVQINVYRGMGRSVGLMSARAVFSINISSE